MDERKEIRQVIFSNLIVAFKIIAEEMRELGIEYENSVSSVTSSPGGRAFKRWLMKEYERIIAGAEEISTEDHFPTYCLAPMKGLWEDSAVQQTIRRGNEYALHDNIQ